MFAVTLIGTFELLMLMFIQQEIINPSPAFGQVFSQIVLPTILLNMLLAIPVHAIIHDLARRLYPDKEAA
jgi:cell shape-determining protein MreD